MRDARLNPEIDLHFFASFFILSSVGRFLAKKTSFILRGDEIDFVKVSS